VAVGWEGKESMGRCEEVPKCVYDRVYGLWGVVGRFWGTGNDASTRIYAFALCSSGGCVWFFFRVLIDTVISRLSLSNLPLPLCFFTIIYLFLLHF